MKIKEGVIVYSCEHCNKKLFRKHAMENHEKWCSKNPANHKACSGCAFLEETKVKYIKSGFNGYCEVEEERSSKAFMCTKKDKLLYPLIVEKKGLLKEYPETFENQEPMPRECSEWNYTKD